MPLVSEISCAHAGDSAQCVCTEVGHPPRHERTRRVSRRPRHPYGDDARVSVGPRVPPRRGRSRGSVVTHYSATPIAAAQRRHQTLGAQTAGVGQNQRRCSSVRPHFSRDRFCSSCAPRVAIALATSGSPGVAGAGRLLHHACDRPVVETSFDVRTWLPARGQAVPLCAEPVHAHGLLLAGFRLAVRPARDPAASSTRPNRSGASFLRLAASGGRFAAGAVTLGDRQIPERAHANVRFCTSAGQPRIRRAARPGGSPGPVQRGRFCPIPAARPPAAWLLLSCLHDPGIWLAPGRFARPWRSAPLCTLSALSRSRRRTGWMRVLA